VEQLIKNETNKYAKRFYENLYKDGYILTGNNYYEKSGIHVEVRCNEGHVYKTKPEVFNQGYRCLKCANEKIKQKTIEKYKEKFYKDIKKEGYKIKKDSYYKNARTYITITCPFGHDYKVKPTAFYKGDRCVTCFKIKQRQGFIDRADFLGYEILNIEEYKSSGKKVKIRCNKNHTFEIAPENVGRDHKCLYCFHDTKSDAFYDQVKSRGYKTTNKTKYTKRTERVEIECPKGHKFLARPDSFMNGHGCSTCSKNKKRTHEEFIKEVFNLVGSEYSVLSEYKGNMKKVIFRHNEKRCKNHEWKVSPADFISQGSRCPFCRESKGERSISDFLIKNKIGFEREKTFKNLKFKNPLRFDFYLKDYNTLIEYDGEHHFIPISYGNTESQKKESVKKLKIVNARDEIKNIYADDNGIKLLRIPYWEFNNIEEILKKELASTTHNM